MHLSLPLALLKKSLEETYTIFRDPKVSYYRKLEALLLFEAGVKRLGKLLLEKDQSYFQQHYNLLLFIWMAMKCYKLDFDPAIDYIESMSKGLQ